MFYKWIFRLYSLYIIVSQLVLIHMNCLLELETTTEDWIISKEEVLLIWGIRVEVNYTEFRTLRTTTVIT